MTQKPRLIGLLLIVAMAFLACVPSVRNREGNPGTTIEVTVAVEPQQTPVVKPDDLFAGTAGTIAREHLAYISQVIGARPVGSRQETQAAEYIADTLALYGYQVEIQPFDFYDEDQGEMKSTNIIAVKQGLSPEEILVGAHYDSVSWGEGADDNASGVGVLLELAQRVQAVNTPYTVRFIAFGAEEIGMEGSYYYAVHLSSNEIDEIVGMINLDSVIAGDYLYIYSNVEVDAEMQEKLVDENTAGIDFIAMTLEELDMGGEYPCTCSDYQPFSELDIPFVYIEATNWEMGDRDGYTQTGPEFGVDGGIIHTKFDSLDYFEQVFPGRVDRQLGFLVTELYDYLVNFE